MSLFGDFGMMLAGASEIAQVAAGLSLNWNHPSLTISNSGRTIFHTAPGTTNTNNAGSIDAKATGKWYFECVCDSLQSAANIAVGVSTVDVSLNTNLNTVNAVTLCADGKIYPPDGSNPSFTTALVDGDIICVAVDADTRGVQVRKNNGSWSSTYTLTGTNAILPIVELRKQNQQATFNFLSSQFVYSPPSGYAAWTKNADYAGRYWRFRAFNGNFGGHNIAEIAMRLTSGGSNQIGSGSASASTEFSGTYAASKAVDANNSTFWASNAELTSAWWQYDFGSNISIQEIVMKLRSDTLQYPSPFCFQYAKSGASGVWYPAGWSNVTWTQGEQKTFAVAGG